MALRIKAGGPNSVISQADAKKMGLLKTTVNVVTAAEKLKKPIVNAKEEKKTGASNKDAPEEKKASGGGQATKLPAKNGPITKQSIISAATAGVKKGASDDSDPIEESLNIRKKAGGVNEVVPLDKKAAKPAGGIKPPTGKPTTSSGVAKEEK